MRGALGSKRVTAATLGTAALKILRDEINPASLPGAIERCAWCQTPRHVCCWHEAAQVLLEQGLRPGGYAPAAADNPAQMELLPAENGA